MVIRVMPEFTGDNRLMFITHKTSEYDEIEEVKMAIEGGCSWVQLRMKEHYDKLVARKCRLLCGEAGREVVFCVNDYPAGALEAGATACHLGKNDIAIDEAWKIVDEKLMPSQTFYIGATANSFEDIKLSCSLGASYIGLGPYRYTTTKSKLSPILGLEGYREIVSNCRAEGINIPIFAIGGITLEDVGPLMETGVTGLAVSGAIINADDPVAQTRRFIEEINKY